MEFLRAPAPCQSLLLGSPIRIEISTRVPFPFSLANKVGLAGLAGLAQGCCIDPPPIFTRSRSRRVLGVPVPRVRMFGIAVAASILFSSDHSFPCLPVFLSPLIPIRQLPISTCTCMLRPGRVHALGNPAEHITVELCPFPDVQSILNVSVRCVSAECRRLSPTWTFTRHTRRTCTNSTAWSSSNGEHEAKTDAWPPDEE